MRDPLPVLWMLRAHTREQAVQLRRLLVRHDPMNDYVWASIAVSCVALGMILQQLIDAYRTR